MATPLRESMTWLHTWAGVVLGALLLAIFWMGTLSLFDREIDRWMQPDTRLALPKVVSMDAARPAIDAAVGEADSWFYILPSEREPSGRLFYTGADGERVQASVDLTGGRVLPRSSLDLHNLSGVLGLPFHFVITISGLIIFFNIYFPQAPDLAYGAEDNPGAAFFQESFGGYSREPAGEPAPRRVSIDAVMQRASASWGGAQPWSVAVTHAGDAASYVEVRRSYADQVTMNRDQIFFDAATGEVLHRFEAPPVMSAQRFISGLHFIQFDHWPLRWLYFVLGLSGCVMIATGYIYWLETRRKRHARLGLPGVRLVEGLTVGSVTGIVIATLAFFIANRLLPLGASFAGYERAALEVWAFYLVWLASFAHARLRPAWAWREQCWAIAALALLAPVLNGVTTGDYLLKTLLEGYWPVAGMDLLLLAAAGIAVYAARKLSGPSDDTADGKAADKKARELAG